MNAAELFVKCLENEGVEYIFGVPGEENAHFMIALESSPIKFILCRHEQGAAFMADTYGRLTGKPGVCLGTLGPGATNLVTGVANANMDRSPVIAITGQADSRRQHKESHQNMDVVAMFKPITKSAHPIIQASNIPEVIRKSFKLAKMEKPGACHIELADDIAKVKADYIPMPIINPRRPVPDDKTIDKAVSIIKSSKNPIILAGNGTIRKRASKQLRAFVKSTGISVVNTFMGKGCVPRDSSQCLFTIGLQANDYSWLAIENSDLIITLGYDLVEYHPYLWNSHEGHNHNHERKIIHIDFLPAEPDDNYRVDLEIVGDLAHTLWMLNECVKKNQISKFNQKYNQNLRKKFIKDFDEYKDDDSNNYIKPQKILWDVREVLGPCDILLSDVGAHKMWIARYYHCDEPNTCLIPNGFCSMGFALPGAISAKLVHKDRKVLAICGDGGFMMNVQELETARRIGTNIVVMIWEDHAYGLIKWKQKIEFNNNTDLGFNNPDFVKLAESFDCIGMRIEKSSDLKKSLKQAFNYDKPVLITIPVDYRENEKLSKRLGNIKCCI